MRIDVRGGIFLVIGSGMVWYEKRLVLCFN